MHMTKGNEFVFGAYTRKRKRDLYRCIVLPLQMNGCNAPRICPRRFDRIRPDRLEFNVADHCKEVRLFQGYEEKRSCVVGCTP